jgi:eukaryotic-like serine/threonine-protein kinase
MTALLRLPELTKYELLEEIGHGGMATVYRARDRRLGREVAVKLIHHHLRNSSEVAERFAREATAVAKLRHPGIVEVYDVSDPDEPERYLVVELVRGVTLRDRLREGPLPPEVAAAVTIEVGAALEHAHRQGVIHRDVKPENVLIELPRSESDNQRSPMRIKLTDFGIAKLLDAQGVTSTGQVLGSPAHMAPEQIEGGAVDARTDVFALGVLLYEAMVGRLPFYGDHPAQVLRRVLDGEFIAAERQDAKIGTSYSRIASRALARLPEQRFDSVQAMIDGLRRELANLGFTRPQPLLEAVLRPDPLFQDELVTRLVERGTQARSEGQIGAAAELFGRALAYRPGDRQLLRRVSGLARTRELRRIGRGVLIAAGVALVGVAVSRQLIPDSIEPVPLPVGGSVARPAAVVPSAPGPAPPAALQEGPSNVANATAVGGVANAAEVEGARPSAGAEPVKPALRPAGPLPVPRAPSPRRGAGAVDSDPSMATRDVVVRITGAMGGTLQIDGEPVQWFGGVRHALTLGPHRFTFLAPDSTCCQSSERTVLVTAGEGPLQVIGEIPFVDATLRVSAEEDLRGVLTCPTLFSGEQRFPGERKVTMSRVSVSGTCTLRAEVAANAASSPEAAAALPQTTAVPLPQKIEVTLRAGQTTVIPWP